ncbi:MAG TPA: CBS domain-containing protein [Longimicrobiales bacterium]
MHYASMLTLRDIMTDDVVYVHPDTPLSEVVAILRTEGITGVPVVNREQVVGVVSASDILEFTEEGAMPDAFDQLEDPVELFDTYTAADLMTRKVRSLPPATTLAAAAREMVQSSVHRLLVMEHGKLIGIATSMDFLRALADGRVIDASEIAAARSD